MWGISILLLFFLEGEEPNHASPGAIPQIHTAHPYPSVSPQQGELIVSGCVEGTGRSLRRMIVSSLLRRVIHPLALD